MLTLTILRRSACAVFCQFGKALGAAADRRQYDKFRFKTVLFVQPGLSVGLEPNSSRKKFVRQLPRLVGARAYAAQLPIGFLETRQLQLSLIISG